MENASKALIMAGTILIGILLIALLVYFFNSVLGVDKAYKENISTTRIVEFNTKFTKYNITDKQYRDSDGKSYVTIYDIITLGNLAAEFNNDNDLTESDDEYIKIGIWGKGNDPNISDNNSTENNELLKKHNDVANNKFVACELIYNESGRIKKMTFELMNEK